MWRRSRVGNAFWRNTGSLGDGTAGDARCMIDDSTNPTAFMNAFSVSHFSFFIKDFTSLAIDACISISISFIIVSLV